MDTDFQRLSRSENSSLTFFRFASANRVDENLEPLTLNGRSFGVASESDLRSSLFGVSDGLQCDKILCFVQVSLVQ
jgi:hypothetical protein